MTYIELDMIQTAGIGAFALIIGMILTRRVSFLPAVLRTLARQRWHHFLPLHTATLWMFQYRGIV